MLVYTEKKEDQLFLFQVQESSQGSSGGFPAEALGLHQLYYCFQN